MSVKIMEGRSRHTHTHTHSKIRAKSEINPTLWKCRTMKKHNVFKGWFYQLNYSPTFRFSDVQGVWVIKDEGPKLEPLTLAHNSKNTIILWRPCIFLSLFTHAHTHTHTHIYIYIYITMIPCQSIRYSKSYGSKLNFF